ncbi:hydrolase [Siccirubricoccus deserti]|uniref:Alpha/beta hydrolase n=1 Tax=Siccirubricoccus deserti TaxID=2013562 RepID=A0A9X0UBV1_9PROT|nr:alpha/beta hydrolase [Siccirubricoccus deserti]MBC4014439.1 alpha/beta hydrolase [Siccirubricoccus deserti]GGC32856.1 hydrolase [Siccirubricoccus deserti]
MIGLPDGRRLEAQWWGPGPEAAPSLVLLHQGLGSVSFWGEFPARLAAATGCGVLAYSRLGYGQSDPRPLPWQPGYLHDEAQIVLPRLLDAAGVRRCVLLGHSDGGSIAAIHAGTVEDARVRGAVLLAPHFIVEEITRAGVQVARARWEASGRMRERLAPHHRDPDLAFHGWNDAWLDPGFADGFDLRPELAALRVPLLIIQGEADIYGTPEQLRIAERAAPALVETLLLPGIGHAPQEEAPEAVLAAVRGFLAKVLPPGPG